MKIIAIVAVASLVTQAATVFAQAGDMKGMEMKSVPTEKKLQTVTHKTSGVVKKMDAAKGTVTLAHGPVKDLKWPAMTMGFTVKDKTLFDKLAVDRKVEFEFIEQGSSYVITAVK